MSNTPRQKGNSNHSYQSCEFNISARVIQELDKNPLLKPKHLCYILGLDYLYYKNYVKNLRSKWKRNYRFGLHPKSPNSHNARAVVYVPKSCDRAFAINEGWEVSKNRNKGLFWKDVLGRIEWFQTGRVIVYIKSPQTMARVKTLLCKAFHNTGLIFDSKVLDQFLSKVRWKSAHDTYETNSRLPHKIIDNYVTSHGIKIVTGDSTHPNSIEIQWCRPDWLEYLLLMKEINIRARGG